MRILHVVFFLLLLVYGSTAQLTIADLPPCGLTCLLQTVPAAGCSLTDTTCQCGNQALAEASFACILGNCTMSDALGVSKVQASICNLPNEDRSREVIVVAFTLDALAAILIMLRLCHKAKTRRDWGWDDTIIGATLILLVADIYLLTTMANQGFGKHLYQLGEGDLLRFLRNFYIATIFYVFILGLVKVSILVFYLRLFPYESFRPVVLVSMFYVVASTITVTSLAMFQCKPIQNFWNRDIDGRCLNINAMAYVASGFTISSDFLILVLPIPVVSKLNLGLKKKLGVILMFGVGGFGCIVSVIRLRSLIFYGKTVDPTFDLVMAVLWSAVEIPVAMICACFPAMRRLFVHVFPNVFHTTHPTTEDSQQRSLPLSWLTASSGLKSVEERVKVVFGRRPLVLPSFDHEFEFDLMEPVVTREERAETSWYESRGS